MSETQTIIVSFSSLSAATLRKDIEELESLIGSAGSESEDVSASDSLVSCLLVSLVFKAFALCLMTAALPKNMFFALCLQSCLQPRRIAGRS